MDGKIADILEQIEEGWSTEELRSLIEAIEDMVENMIEEEGIINE